MPPSECARPTEPNRGSSEISSPMVSLMGWPDYNTEPAAQTALAAPVTMAHLVDKETYVLPLIISI